MQRWIIAHYQPTTLWSLKPAWATSSGGKTVLVPTPFALKMALLDVAIRSEGLATGRAVWSAVRDAQIALQPPPHIVVNNLFTKVLRVRRNPAEEGSAHAGPFGKTIAYREYLHADGPWAVAIAADFDPETLRGWLAQINYLGKRGSFIQLLSLPEMIEAEMPSGPAWVLATGTNPSFDPNGLLHQLDDCAPDKAFTFEKADIYSGKPVALGKERILRPVVLPYRLVRSSRGYSFYRRADMMGEDDGTV